MKAPPFTDIERAIQLALVRERAHQIYDEQAKANPNRKIKVIFGGDFNSLPDSACLKMLSNSADSAEHEGELELLKSLQSYFESKPRFQNILTPEKTFETNLTKNFEGCIDYLTVMNDCKDQKKLNQDLICKNLCTFEDELLDEATGERMLLPNRGFLSDHLPILAAIRK